MAWTELDQFKNYTFKAYFDSLKEEQHPASLLKAYYDYILWLEKKQAFYTSTEILYQLRVMNGFFANKNTLDHFDVKEIKCLDSLIKTDLHHTRAYRAHFNENWSRAKFLLCILVAVGLCILPVLGSVFSYWTAGLIFLATLIRTLESMGGDGVRINNQPFMLPNIKIPGIITCLVLGAIGAVCVAFAFYVPMSNTVLVNFLTIVGSPLFSAPAFLLTYRFIQSPETKYELQNAKIAESVLSNDLKAFYNDVNDPLNNALNATQNCVLRSFRKNPGNEPVIEMSELRSELEKKVVIK